MAQTDIQKTSAIRYGALKVEVGDSLLSLVDVGAGRDFVIRSVAENQIITFDNVNELKKFVKGDQFEVEFMLNEINWSTFAVIDSGLVNVSSVAGTPVTGQTQVVASGDWDYNQFIPLEHQMYDGSANTISTVVGSVDGALVSETDFFKGYNDVGIYGIFIKNSVTVTTTAQSITITYNYTPAAHKSVTFTEQGTKTLKYARFTNTDQNNNTLIFEMSDVTNISPIEIDMAGDTEDDVAGTKVIINGKITEIRDGQQTT